MSIHSSDQRMDVEALSVYVTEDQGRHVVHAVGVLTADTRNAFFCCCLAPGHVHVVVDMRQVSLLDRDGYAAVLAVRRVLEAEGGSLVLRHVASSSARFVLATGNTEVST